MITYDTKKYPFRDVVCEILEVDDLKTLSMTAMNPMLVKSIQEHQTLIETQQTTINDLKSRIETLEG